MLHGQWTLSRTPDVLERPRACRMGEREAHAQNMGRWTFLLLHTLPGRIQEWVAMPSSRGSSQPRNQTQDGSPNIGNNKTILRLIALYYIGLREAPIWIN